MCLSAATTSAFKDVGSIDPHCSRLRHFKLHWSNLREQQRVAQFESVCGAEARPPLREGAELLLSESVCSSLHRRPRLRADENVPRPIEALGTVFAPESSWNILRRPQSQLTKRIIPQCTLRFDPESGIELWIQEMPKNIDMLPK